MDVLHYLLKTVLSTFSSKQINSSRTSTNVSVMALIVNLHLHFSIKELSFSATEKWHSKIKCIFLHG